MGGIFLAGHICSAGGNCCTIPQLNPFEMDGPGVRLQGWEAALEPVGADSGRDEDSLEVCRCLTSAIPTAHL